MVRLVVMVLLRVVVEMDFFGEGKSEGGGESRGGGGGNSDGGGVNSRSGERKN